MICHLSVVRSDIQRIVIPQLPNYKRYNEESGTEIMSQYPIVFALEEDGRYSVFAPDLPGCTSWGNTRDEASEHIKEAIEAWIESALADGEALPSS